MKKLIFLSLVVVLLGSTGLGQGQDRDLSFDAGVKPHAGLDAVYRQFSQAYRDLDHEKVGGLYARDAAYLVPDEDLITGRDNITPTFKSFFDQVRDRKGKLRISFRIVQRRVSGDMGYDVGVYTLTQTDPAGRTSTGNGKFVVVAVKDREDWLFQVDGYNGLAKPNE